MEIITAISGASGALYAQRFLHGLVAAGVNVQLVVSPWGRRLLRDELGMETVDLEALAGTKSHTITLHNYNDVASKLASGSFIHDGMIIVPCSSNTLAEVAHGLGDNLISRAAAVTLKERRKLIVVHREMPLSPIDVNNYKILSDAGVILAPANPGYYLNPTSVGEVIDFVAGKLLDLLGVAHALDTRWDPANVRPPAGDYDARMKFVHAALVISFLVGIARGQSDFFPITPWELPHEKQKHLGDPRHGVSSLRDCGFNTAAFVTLDQLPLCEKAQMRAIVALPGPPMKWRQLTDTQIADRVKKLIGNSAADPMVVGYFLTDEPNAAAFAALGKAVAAVKKLAPQKLAYINLYPNYATLGAENISQLGTATYEEYLERFVNEVKPQFLSYDNYQVQYSNDLENMQIGAGYFVNLMQVRKIAQQHKLPFWHIVASNQIRPHMPIPSAANLSVQAYTTLAAGARGLTWYTYYVGGYHYAPIDRAGNRTGVWAQLKLINEQVQTLAPILTRLTSSGVFFTSPPDKSLPPLPGKLITSITSANPLMLGEFTGSDGARHAMVVNLNLQRSCKLTIQSAGDAQMRVISPVDGASAALESPNELWLTAGQGALLELK
jgi:polyprenyl P-hydroxybenzoate/phenylacrylic acid decarboxylase-like protein